MGSSVRRRRRKRVLERELRDLCFRLFTVAGGVSGLLWAAHHRYLAPKHLCQSALRAPKAGDVAAAGAQCLGSDLSHAILAWVFPVGVGLLIGALVGVLLARMIRLGRPRGAPAARKVWRDG